MSITAALDRVRPLNKPKIMPLFNDHEMVVLSNALSRIHLIYSYPEHSCSEDQLASKAIKMVFKSRYPGIQADQNIITTFTGLMERMYAEMRGELAAWYIDTQDVCPPKTGADTQQILDFTVHLTVISHILREMPPETTETNTNSLQDYLNLYWAGIKRKIYNIYQ